jgi:hypothetical protein
VTARDVIHAHLRLLPLYFTTTDESSHGLSAQTTEGGISSKKNDAQSESSDSLDLENLICFTCHRNHDFSDRDEYPLGDPRYDPCNAVLLCDNNSCRAKAYHQRCHFVPVFSIPRGEWICLLCQFEDKKGQKEIKQVRKSTTPKKSATKDLTLSVAPDGPPGEIKTDNTTTGNDFANDNAVQALLLEFDRKAGALKADTTLDEVTRLEKSIDQSLAAIRNAEHAILSYTESQRARKSLIANFPRLPTELINGKIRYASSKFKIRMQLTSLQSYIKDFPPRFEPRFGEKSPGKPVEEKMAASSCEGDASKEKALTNMGGPLKKSGKGNKDKNKPGKNIHSEELKCCVCYDRESTRKNDGKTKTEIFL